MVISVTVYKMALAQTAAGIGAGHAEMWNDDLLARAGASCDSRIELALSVAAVIGCRQTFRHCGEATIDRA